MEILDIISNQYLATIKMLENAVSACPETLWLDTGYKNRFWHVAYHGLFYTHLYLQVDEASFHPWEHHRKDYQFMGAYPWPPHEIPQIDEPYTRVELLEYAQFCRQEVGRMLPVLNMEGSSGFSWQPMSKLELQLYNIRHLQQHIGELYERLGNQGIEVDWVGSARIDK